MTVTPLLLLLLLVVWVDVVAIVIVGYTVVVAGADGYFGVAVVDPDVGDVVVFGCYGVVDVTVAALLCCYRGCHLLLYYECMLCCV